MARPFVVYSVGMSNFKDCVDKNIKSAIQNICLKYVHDYLQSLINDLRHSGTTKPLYRFVAVSKKNGLK